MTKHLTLLLFIGLAWGQNTSEIESDFDKLVSKGGTIFLGEFSRIEKSVVYFKPTKASAFQGVPINQVQSLKLKDGQTIIKNGNVNQIRNIVDYEKLSLEEKAIYDAKSDAKKDAKRWLAYPPLALIGAGGLATATFFIGEDIFEIDDDDILLPSIIGGGSLGMIGSYYLFNKLDKNKIEAINSFDNEDYEKLYLQEFKKRKSENIILSGSLIGLATGLTVLLLFESTGGGWGGYDVCFDPRCD